jgi:hypothetical protein
MKVTRGLLDARRCLAAHDDKANLRRFERSLVTIVFPHGEAMLRLVEESHDALCILELVHESEVLIGGLLPRFQRNKESKNRDRTDSANPKVNRAHIPSLLRGGLAVRQLRIPPQVPVGVAELAFDHRHAFEEMADIEFVGHAHAAVDLHGFLADQLARLADLHLGA